MVLYGVYHRFPPLIILIRGEVQWHPRLLQTLQPAVAMNPDLKDAKIINVDLADMSAWLQIPQGWHPAGPTFSERGHGERGSPHCCKLVVQPLNDLGEKVPPVGLSMVIPYISGSGNPSD